MAFWVAMSVDVGLGEGKGVDWGAAAMVDSCGVVAAGVFKELISFWLLKIKKPKAVVNNKIKTIKAGTKYFTFSN